MTEFFDKVFNLPYWEVVGDSHGGLAMLSLILFGASIMLFFSLGKFKTAARWLKYVLWGLFANLLVLDILGLYVYIPYRAKEGAKAVLIASESTAWLHEIIFEHKEFLAFAPMVLILVAAIIVTVSGSKVETDSSRRQAVLFSIICALVFVLVVAAEAVLVTKAAPVR